MISNHKKTEKMGSIDPGDSIREHVNREFDAMASKRDMRSRRYREVSEAETIGLIYSPDTPGSLLPTPSVEHQSLWRSLDNLPCLVKRWFGPGYVARCLIARIRAGGSVAAHIDPGFGFSIPHRIHWVLETNEGAHFLIGGERLHMPLGEVWEVDNKSAHAVENRGETPRTHVILDYVAARDRSDHYCLVDTVSSEERKLLQYWFSRRRNK